MEWDLALLPLRALEEYERVSGTRVDRDILAVMEGVRLLQTVSALAFVPRMPEMGQMLTPFVEQWRERAPLTASLWR
ncbi:hypothetical protein [Streptomyces sp. NPDC053048]|uniref:hypothetical protein n=1 Tax=Streptomyces sp. NPDC053048 TaxID=3365694 RepID=UPI0037D7F27C